MPDSRDSRPTDSHTMYIMPIGYCDYDSESESDCDCDFDCKCISTKLYFTSMPVAYRLIPL